MPNFNDMFRNPASMLGNNPDRPSTLAGNSGPKVPKAKLNGSDAHAIPMDGTYDDAELLGIWERIQKEAFENRSTFERQWQRNVWYVLGRQWIEYISRYGGWRDKRMATWIPRPVTNKCKETVQAIRAMFTSITLGINVRPNGQDPVNVSVAATADALAPVLHEVHHMDHNQQEFDFWLIVTGNAFYHTYVDYDVKYGKITITAEQCQTCQTVTPSNELAGAQPICPECGGSDFQQATHPETGEPLQDIQPQGRPVTCVLSPLEVAFPASYPRFEELPYIVRMRWRTRRYYENHPQLKDLVEKITWQKAPQDSSLSLFQSLSRHNDMGLTPTYWAEGASTGGQHEDGITEYEIWMKPCADYPDGLVFRVIGDADAQVVHLEDTEALPGPLPYKDAAGNPLWTFTHAAYEHVGGRILGSGAIDVIIQKQDQLNQLDSMILLIIQRMANPVWLEPKGAEIQKLTGMPGLVIKWNPLTVGGNAKPERIPGVGPDASLFTIREQYLRDIEELSGTFDVIKGQKPTGVEAFSALQLLVERSQARFASVFTARGEAYRDWFKFALELEREFGPDERTKATQAPDKGWTFENFKRAQLQGDVSVIVEDGTQAPKTSLGMRAALDHASQLGMLNLHDPDQQYEGLKLFGLTRMVPQLDVHVQAAGLKQQNFEKWAASPQNIRAFAQTAKQLQDLQDQKVQAYQGALAVAAQDPSTPMPPQIQPAPSPLEATPLRWLPWYDPMIHRLEFMKWANSDKVRALLQQNPGLDGILALHLQEMTQAVIEAAQQAMGGAQQQAPPQAQGAGRAMTNSNANSAPAGNKAQPSQGV